MIKQTINKVVAISLLLINLSACEMFEIDNYEGPNATLKGGIIDAETGELVETTLVEGSTLKLDEIGWAPGGTLTRVVKENGEYQDDMMFSGKYKVTFSECNFYPFVVNEINVKKGQNVIDFEVTPYIRIIDPEIKLVGKEIIATFKLQGGKPEVKLSHIRLYHGTDMYAGEPYSLFSLTGPVFQSFDTPIEIDENQEFRLVVDLTHPWNEYLLRYKKNYYFRIGALASVPNVGTVRRNYAPYVVINFSAAELN